MTVDFLSYVKKKSGKRGQEWARVGKSRQGWARVGKSGQGWANKGKDGQEWANKGKDGQEWANMGKDGHEGVYWACVYIKELRVNSFSPTAPSAACPPARLMVCLSASSIEPSRSPPALMKCP